MLDPELVRQAREAIAKLEMVSHGTTLNYDGDGRGGSEAIYPVTGHRKFRNKHSRVRLLGDLEPEHIELQRRLLRATTDSDLIKIRDLAISEHAQLVRQTDVPHPEVGSLQWKREIANSDLTVSELARLYAISRPTVYSYQKRYGNTQRAA